jgi:hypothetical protein
MSTRSTIGLERPDGSILCSYAHWDGYPHHHGPILLRNYNTPEKVEALLEHGDISILGEVPGLTQDFDHPQDGYTLYYGRDRGEEGTEVHAVPCRLELIDLANHNGSEWIYLFAGIWLCQPVVWGKPPKAVFEDLREVMKREVNDLICRIPSFTWMSEEAKADYAQEMERQLEALQ